jgi:hypothetical protein
MLQNGGRRWSSKSTLGKMNQWVYDFAITYKKLRCWFW